MKKLWFFLLFIFIFYPFEASALIDDFSVDTRIDYTVTHTLTQGGTGQFLYDSTGKRLRVLTGDDVGLQFSRDVPVQQSGGFQIDFLPTKKYPSGGKIYVRLVQDGSNYYEMMNSDGYGPGWVRKVVNGQEVERQVFQSGYVQGVSTTLGLAFSPGTAQVEAFGQTLVLGSTAVPISVSSFEVQLAQQDAYFDNLLHAGSFFLDDFSTDTRSQYLVTHTWTQGGTGQFLYDSTGKRLRVLTGDNVGLKFSRRVTVQDNGAFHVDFLPTRKYPNGGKIYVRLVQDASRYYEMVSSDGYDPGWIRKVVNGQEVEKQVFQNGYVQNTGYSVALAFSPALTQVEAFGQTLVLGSTVSPISVSLFEVELSQQDGYFDNITYAEGSEGNRAPLAVNDKAETVAGTPVVVPVLSNDTDGDGTINPLTMTVVVSPSRGTATVNADGTVLYSPSPGFIGTDEFRYSVKDDVGATSNVATVTVTVRSSSALFQDDFSTNTLGGYTVTHTWTTGGTGRLVYDPTGKRLQVLTGNDIGLKLGRSLSARTSGRFQLDFLPTKKYPNGGKIYLRLMESASSYYEMVHSDGYGAGWLRKVVNGQEVEKKLFQSMYVQGVSYPLVLSFSPGTTQVQVFGQTLVLGSTLSPVAVNRFEVELSQQDAYIDNIVYADMGGVNSAPVAANDSAETVEETAVVVQVLSNDTDSDGSLDPSTVSVVVGPVHGTATVNGNGTISYSPDPGYAGTDVLSYTVRDNAGAASNTATVSVTVLVSGPSFLDDFSADTRSSYTVTQIWTAGGAGRLVYDSTAKRLQALTGNDVGMKFARSLAAPRATGIFQLDFLPTVKYPSGGKFYLRLVQDASNYYEVMNSDGYGPGYMRKLVNGQEVEKKVFQSGYVQGVNTMVVLNFSPERTQVQAFGQTLVLDLTVTPITVSRFEVELSQQDAYIDNIKCLSIWSMGGVVFTNITNASNRGSLQGGHGAVWGDIDQDGDPDVYVTRNFSNQTMSDLLFMNVDGSSYLEQGLPRGVADVDTGTHGGVWADLDNDGDFDLWNGAYTLNNLYSNDGTGSFTDVTAQAGIVKADGQTRGVIAFDMDNDGDLDLFANNWGSTVGQENELYRNEGGMYFTRLTGIPGDDLGKALGSQGGTAGDIDGDGDTDFILADYFALHNVYAFLNNGSGVFTLQSNAQRGLPTTGRADGVTLADLDNDADLDLIIASPTTKSIYLNNGSGVFSLRTTLNGPGFMTAAADFDNDGDLDLYNPGESTLWLNNGLGEFVMAAGNIGIPNTSGNDPRCSSVADIDGDGDLDIISIHKAGYNVLLRNDTPTGNSWLRLNLQRASGQQGAFGSKVYAFQSGHMGDVSRLVAFQELSSQQGYLAQYEPVVHLGLGANTRVDIRVVFPGGRTVSLPGVSGEAVLTVQEP